MEIVLEDLLECVEIAVSHGLYDESLVLRKEEEASTFPLRLSSLENAIYVLLRAETLLDDIIGDLIKVS